MILRGVPSAFQTFAPFPGLESIYSYHPCTSSGVRCYNKGFHHGNTDPDQAVLVAGLLDELADPFVQMVRDFILGKTQHSLPLRGEKYLPI